MRDWKEWIHRAGIREIKTVAQTAVATIGTAAFMGAVDWKMVVSASALAGIKNFKNLLTNTCTRITMYYVRR